MTNFNIINAPHSLHPEIMKIAKLSKYTRDFSNHMFSGEEMYKKGWISAVMDDQGKVVGFSCVRHKTRTPETSLYFIGLAPEQKGLGLGSRLIDHIKDSSPHRCIQLNVMKDNEPALGFYKRLGFRELGPALKGAGVQLELRW